MADQDLSQVPAIPSAGFGAANVGTGSTSDEDITDLAATGVDATGVMTPTATANEVSMNAPDVSKMGGTVDPKGVVTFTDAKGNPTGIKHYPDGHSEIQGDFGKYVMLPGMTKFTKINPNLKQDPDTKQWIDFTNSEHPRAVHMPEENLNIPAHAHGEAAIVNLSPRDQEYVRDYATYKMPAPTQGRPNPTLNRLLPYITAYNPNWSAQNYGIQQQTLKQFNSQTSGSPGYNVTSVNTALEHLGTVWDRAAALDNGAIIKANSLKNYIANNAGRPEVAEFNDARTRLATELARAVTGGVPTNQQIQEVLNQLDTSSSLAQLKGVIQGTIPEMLNARLGELNTAYERTMGEPYKAIVTPRAQQTLKRFGIDNFGSVQPPSQEPPALRPQAAAAPAPARPPDIQGAMNYIAQFGNDPRYAAQVQKVKAALAAIQPNARPNTQLAAGSPTDPAAAIGSAASTAAPAGP